MLSASLDPYGRVVEALAPQASVLVVGPLAAATEVAKRVARACCLPDAKIVARADGTWHADLTRQKIAWPQAPLVVSVATEAPKKAHEKFDAVLFARGFPGSSEFSFMVERGPEAAFPPVR